MAELTESVTIPRSLADVHRILADMAAFDGWLPSSWRGIEAITQTQVGKGARGALSLDALGMTLPSEIEITEVGPGRVRWSVALPPVEAVLVWELTGDGASTRATLRASWRSRSLPPWRVRTLAKIRLRMDRDLQDLINPLPHALKDAALALASTAPPAEPPAPPSRADSEGFVPVGQLGDVPVGKAIVVGAFGRDVALFNVEGQLHAVENDCPHRQGPLSAGQMEGTIVTCPLHRRRFDVSDGSCLTHPSAPVRAFRVKLVGEEVWLGEAA